MIPRAVLIGGPAAGKELGPTRETNESLNVSITPLQIGDPIVHRYTRVAGLDNQGRAQYQYDGPLANRS